MNSHTPQYRNSQASKVSDKFAFSQLTDKTAGFQQSAFHGRGMRELQLSQTAMTFFRDANIRVHALSTRKLLSTRIVQLPLAKFVHVTMPEAHLSWSRNTDAAQKAILVFCRSGDISLKSSGAFAQRQPGVFFIPPGTQAVEYHTKSYLNEIIYVSFEESFFLDSLRILGLSTFNTDDDPIEQSGLQPLLAFITSFCSVSPSSIKGASTLEHSAYEVARGLLSATFKQQPASSETRFSLAKEYILQHFARKSLTIEDVASHVDVSVRSLQQTFCDEGTSFTELLQNARSSAALNLRTEFPAMKLAEVAARCGYGSLSSLHRAFRAQRIHHDQRRKSECNDEFSMF